MAQRQVPREAAEKPEVTVPPKPTAEVAKADAAADKAAPTKEPEQKRAPGNAATAATAQAAGQKQQDEMLQWIQGRLTTVAEVQRREVEQTSHRNRRAWWDEVADTHKQRKGIRKPEPGQWCDCARQYRDAARAAASGDAVQAARLMRQAVRSEQEAWERLTRLVQSEDLSRPTDFPWSRTVAAGPAPARQVPRGVEALAARIISEDTYVADSPVRLERRGPVEEAPAEEPVETPVKAAAVAPEVEQAKEPAPPEVEKAEERPAADHAPPPRQAPPPRRPVRKGG
jgi:hypothetical protein